MLSRFTYAKQLDSIHHPKKKYVLECPCLQVVIVSWECHAGWGPRNDGFKARFKSMLVTLDHYSELPVKLRGVSKNAMLAVIRVCGLLFFVLDRREKTSAPHQILKIPP